MNFVNKHEVILCYYVMLKLFNLGIIHFLVADHGECASLMVLGLDWKHLLAWVSDMTKSKCYVIIGKYYVSIFIVGI